MMFENIINYLKNIGKKNTKSKETAKERLQLVLTQDRANVSADYLDLMKQEIIEVIKKYINIDEAALEVELTKPTEGVPSLIANIPILSVKSNRDINKKDASQIKKENNQNTKSNNVVKNNKANTQEVQKSTKNEKEVPNLEPKTNSNQSQKNNIPNQKESKQTNVNNKNQKVNNQEEKKNENKPKQNNNKK